MRVLIVCSYKEKMPEGCVPFIREQVAAIRDYLNREDCRLEIGDRRLENEASEVAYYHIKGKGVIGYLREIPTLRRRIKEWKPDVVHAHYGLSCLVANLATRRVPVVSTYHGSDINESMGRKFSRIAMSLSVHNIFVSQRIMDIAHATHRADSSLIPCGVELSEGQLMTREEARKALGWSAEEKKVLFAGAFDNPVKDPELAKASVTILDGVELIELKGYSREQVNTLMCAAHCLLLTSKTEGSPQVVKEAMACGRPIVSVNVGDVAERTEDVDGCYVVTSREPKDIAEVLEKAIAFKGKTDGREKILNAGLSNELVAKRIIEIYHKVVKN